MIHSPLVCCCSNNANSRGVTICDSNSGNCGTRVRDQDQGDQEGQVAAIKGSLKAFMLLLLYVTLGPAVATSKATSIPAPSSFSANDFVNSFNLLPMSQGHVRVRVQLSRGPLLSRRRRRWHGARVCLCCVCVDVTPTGPLGLVKAVMGVVSLLPVCCSSPLFAPHSTCVDRAPTARVTCQRALRVLEVRDHWACVGGLVVVVVVVGGGGGFL